MQIAHFNLECMNIEDGNRKIAAELDYLIGTGESRSLRDELATLDPEDEDYSVMADDIIYRLEALAYNLGYFACVRDGDYVIDPVVYTMVHTEKGESVPNLDSEHGLSDTDTEHVAIQRTLEHDRFVSPLEYDLTGCTIRTTDQNGNLVKETKL